MRGRVPRLPGGEPAPARVLVHAEAWSQVPDMHQWADSAGHAAHVRATSFSRYVHKLHVILLESEASKG